MCCDTRQCCCGCTSMKGGIMIMTGIDLVYNLVLVIVMCVVWGGINPGLIAIALIIAELMLMFGVHAGNTGMMIVFLIVMMIEIVLGFIGWIALPIMYVVSVAASSVVDRCEELANHLDNSDSGFIDKGTGSTYREGCSGFTDLWINYKWLIAFLAIHTVVIPIYYIYYWIVVNSYRKILLAPPPTVIIQAPAQMDIAKTPQVPAVQDGVPPPYYMAGPPGYVEP